MKSTTPPYNKQHMMKCLVEMMAPQTQTFLLLLGYSSLFILSLQTSLANPSCPPSSCGIISNITSPLRLKGDPSYCGDPTYELACESNVTFLYLNSHKYYVKAINYSAPSFSPNIRFFSTIRVVDASININDPCSFPIYSAYHYNFTSADPFRVNSVSTSTTSLNLISCPHPHPLKNSNSSVFIDITHCQTSNSKSPNPRFTYIQIGSMKASDVTESCSVDVIVMTSWKFKNPNNVSLSLQEIHRSLLYGFELQFCMNCRSSWAAWEKFMYFFWTRLRSPFLILMVIVVLSGGTLSPVMSIIGVTIALGFLLSFSNDVFYALRYEAPVGISYTFTGGPSTSISDPLHNAFISSIMIIFGPRFIISLFLARLLIYKFRRRHLSRSDTIESFLQSDNKLVPIRYSYSDIKKMTKNFQDKLGEGGYGSVYKGELRSGQHVAVKLLGKFKANDQDFMNEIATIGRIHHVNIVTLVGYCAEGSKRALILDFMSNGSLEKYIFNQEKRNSLNWDTKFEIVVGVARGIEYLHRGCDIQILHFDIKPHNILLDDKFIPKVSDFGLAKFCSADKNAMTLTAARGTIGYVAPELINRGIGRVSYKADVYSFGMLLIELVGLKRDLRGNKDDSSKYFPCWIYDCFNQEKDIKIEGLDENGNNYENESTRALVRKMTVVALWCIQMNPDDRPSMNKVLKMLEDEVENLEIPQYPLVNENERWETSSSTYSDSVSLLHYKDGSSLEITIEDSRTLPH